MSLEERLFVHDIAEPLSLRPLYAMSASALDVLEEVRVELVLAMDLSDIAGDEDWFIETVVLDIARAIDGNAMLMHTHTHTHTHTQTHT